MVKNLSISVIIPNYNGRGFIGYCIDSILNSNYKNFEILIVDNASTDNSVSFLKRKYKHVKNIRIVSSKNQLYFTGACNLGAKKAKGEFLYFLNSDTTVENNCLTELFSFAKSHKNTIVQPKVLYENDKNRIDNMGGKYILGFGFNIKNGKRNKQNYSDIKNIDYAVGTAFMIEKSLFSNLSGFDQDYKYFYEDVDLCQRAKHNFQTTCWCLSRAVIYHKKGSSFQEISKAYVKNTLRNNIISTTNKNFTGIKKHALLLIQKLIFEPPVFIKVVYNISKISERGSKFEGVFLKRYIFARKFCKNKKVLDVGCGLGQGSNFVALNKALFVKAIDTSRSAIYYARKNFTLRNLDFLKYDALEIDNFNQKFDVVLAFELLEHLPIKYQSEFINKVKKCLIPGGFFIMSTPNKDVTSPDSVKPYNPFHTKEFTYNELKRLLNKSFSRVKIYGIKCINKDFNNFREKRNETLRYKITVFITKFKIANFVLPFIPSKFKNTLSQADKMPNFDENDFIITNKNIDQMEIFIAVCKN